MTLPTILLLIPACNEQSRIGPTLTRYAAHFRDHYAGKLDIVVVINGSTDDTVGAVQQVARDFANIRWLVIPERVGKGGALIEGLKLASQAEVIGYADADAATAPESLLRLAALCADYDCVVGSRRVAGSVIRQSQPSHRQFASKVFHVIVEVLFRMQIRDTQCGAKFLRRSMALKIHDQLLIADMAFDVNLLYAVKRAGGRLIEAPVDWTDHIGSTVRYFRTSLVMFLSVVRLRLVHSPFYRWLRPLRPLETWIYAALRNPPPRVRQPAEPTAPSPGSPEGMAGR
ncbi:MAG: glycosyltransferase [Verrucomicrobia bacterium]|nr:glycosyltransferase [Verrucomicrobiota bacterium]